MPFGMARQGRPVVEHDVRGGIEGQYRQAGVAQHLVAREIVQHGLHRVGIDLRRQQSEQAQRRGAIGGVAAAGEGERAVQRHLQAGRLGGPRLAAQPVEEEARGGHGSHRVRRGRADTDLEDVEDAEKQGSGSRDAGGYARAMPLLPEGAGGVAIPSMC